MELRHLRYFIAVAREENVTRAAARLHVAQPSLSRQIRDLEEELGVALFEHSARSIRLTAAGRHFLTEAIEVMERTETAVRSVRAFAAGPAREIHLGYAPSLTTKILPQALRKFQIRHPHTHVRLHDLSTEEMLAGLRDRSLDAALLVKPSAAALESLLFQEVVRCRPCVAMPLAHPLASESAIDVKSLADESLLVYSRSSYPEYHAWIDRIFRHATRPRIQAEYDSSTSLIASIESGCGVAMVQEGFENLSGSRLAVRPLRNSGRSAFSFGIACRKDDSSKTLRHFVSAVVSTSDPQDSP